MNSSLISFFKLPVNNIFEMLTFNELSATARVSKDWLKAANNAQNTFSQSGMNAGFLYRVTDPATLNAGHLYFHAHSSLKDPLSCNPLLLAIFNKTQFVAFNGFEMLTSEEQVDSMRKWGNSVAQKIKERFSSEELLGLNEKLCAILKEDSPKNWAILEGLTKEGITPEQQICFAIICLYNSGKKRFGLSETFLQRVQFAQKTVCDLSSQNRSLNDHVKAYELFQEWLNMEDGVEELLAPFVGTAELFPKKWVEARNQGFIHGNKMLFNTVSPWDINPWDEVDKKILSVKKLAKRRELLEQMQLIHIQKVDGLVDKIVSLLEQSPLVVTGAENDEMIDLLRQRGIQVLGPIKVPLKPRGFLFEVESPEGKKGTIMGSMHLVPKSLLNFNSACLKYFDAAKVLAVEVDATQKELEEPMLKKEKAYFENELQALCEEEKNALETLFKGLIDPSVQIIEGILPQNRDEFLLWVIPRMGGFFCQKADVVNGIDFAFTERAKEKGLPVEGLESIELHLAGVEPSNYFFEFGSRKFLSQLAKEPPHKAKQLIKSLTAEVKKIIDGMAEMMEFGLTEGLEANELAKKRSEENQERMDQRNRVMAQSFRELVSSGKNPFGIVGASHLAGNSSILKLLRETGYTTRQILCEEPIISELRKMVLKI